MEGKLRFTLRTMLVVIAAVSVPLALVTSGVRSRITVGLICVPIIISGCLGYLAKGWRGCCFGMCTGWAAMVLFLVLVDAGDAAWLGVIVCASVLLVVVTETWSSRT